MPAAPLPAFSAYGIELEYMLADRISLDVRPIADQVLPAHSDTKVAWSHELALHVIELKNPEPRPLSSLKDDFHHAVQNLNIELASRNACLLPTGMHPWMQPTQETRLWPHQDAAIYQTFDRIFDCKRHAWANLQSMHVNLPFADDAEFEKLFAAVRLVLPILPAVAASSPLVEGNLSGYMDYRMQAYAQQSPAMPTIVGEVVPELIHNRAEHESKILAPMYAEIAGQDPHHTLHQEWLNSRAAIPRFARHALEIRILDMQESVSANLALAALTVDLVHLLYAGEFASLQRQQALRTENLRAILDACNRDAEEALINDMEYLSVLRYPGGRCDAKSLWAHLGERLAASGAAHRHLWQTHLAFILKHGPLARRILDALQGGMMRSDLRAVYTLLVSNLHHDSAFLV